jgi:membrane-associated phospholipid phosphatase
MRLSAPVLMLFLCANYAFGQLSERSYDVLQHLPSLGYLSSSYFEQGSNFKKDATLYGISFISMATTVKSLKYLTQIERPDGSDFNSFPSGHAAVSFMGAELMRSKYKNKAEYWIPAYLMAGIVSAQRINSDQHRPLEVLSGAFIGIASVHLGKWIIKQHKKHKRSHRPTN